MVLCTVSLKTLIRPDNLTRSAFVDHLGPATRFRQFPEAPADNDEQSLRGLALPHQDVLAGDVPPGQSLLDVPQQFFRQVAEHLPQYAHQFPVVEPGRQDRPQPPRDFGMPAEVAIEPFLGERDEMRLGSGPEDGRALVAGGRPHFAHDIAGDDRGQYPLVANRAAVRQGLDDLQAAGRDEVERTASGSVESEERVFVESNGFQFGAQTIQARVAGAPHKRAVGKDLHRIHTDDRGVRWHGWLLPAWRRRGDSRAALGPGRRPRGRDHRASG